MKIKFKNLIKNTSILSLPGIISVLISIFSIPIHLNTLGFENYGNFIFFHFLLMLSINLNFGIGKSTVISMNNFPNYKYHVSYEALKYTKKIVIYLSLAFIFFFFISKIKLFLIFEENYALLLFLGSIITLTYVTLEGIFQGIKKFKEISFFNLLFFSFSFSVPSLLLYYLKNLTLNELILISILIKLITLIIMYFLINHLKLIKKNNKKILLYNLKKNSKWITLNGILIQLFDLIDKYFIKIFLGPTSLAIYSIPQQLTGKLSIISKSFSTYLLPSLSKKTKTNDLEISIQVFLVFIPAFIIILIPFYPIFLKFWLSESYNQQILLLTKIFTFVAIFACLSHILTTNFEAKKKLHLNFKLEIIFAPFFIIILFYLINFKYSLLIIGYFILFKEVLLFLLRLIIQRQYFFQIKFYFIYSLIAVISLFFSIYLDSYSYFVLILIATTRIIELKFFSFVQNDI